MIGIAFIESHRVLIAYALLAIVVVFPIVLLIRARRSFSWYRDRITWARKQSLMKYYRKGKTIWRFSFEKTLPSDHCTGMKHRAPDTKPGLHARDLWPPNSEDFRKFVHSILHLPWYQVKRKRKTGYYWTLRRPRDMSRVRRREGYDVLH